MEEEMVVKELHDPIINEETFEKVQIRLLGKQSKSVHIFSQIDETLPLRGHLLCKRCGKLLTGSASRGRNGKRHFIITINLNIKG